MYCNSSRVRAVRFDMMHRSKVKSRLTMANDWKLVYPILSETMTYTDYGRMGGGRKVGIKSWQASEQNWFWSHLQEEEE